VKKSGYYVVKTVSSIKRVLGCKTYHLEAGVLLLILLGVTVLNGGDWIEYLGVAAVFFAFMHATIAEYMREAEVERSMLGPELSATCHHKLPYYFYAKEICWFLYFFLLGAHSALVGVIFFLLYQPWRRLWRKYNPA
jgi:hypothetical protein